MMQAYVARACVCGTRPTRRTVHARTTEPRASNRNGRLFLQGRSANSCSGVGLSRGAVRRVTFRLCLVDGRSSFPSPSPRRCKQTLPANIAPCHPSDRQRHPFRPCAHRRMINIITINTSSDDKRTWRSPEVFSFFFDII